jgi:hypothetical protein
MGQYKFSMYFKWQIGLLFTYEIDELLIQLPFVEIRFGLTKHAHGFCIFGWFN